MTASADYMWVKNYDLPNWKLVSQSVAMSWCAVINCNNKKNNRELSYFWLPKDTTVQKDWIHATGRPIDNLPSKILICSDHSEEKCFDPSWKIQNELYYKDRQISKRLLPGSITTLLTHKKDKRRLFSEKRALTQRGNILFNKVVTGPQATALLKKNICHGFFFNDFV